MRKIQPWSPRTVRKVTERARAQLRGHPGARIGAGVRFTGGGLYVIHPRAYVHPAVRMFVAEGATLILGPSTSIGDRTIINAAEGVLVGQGTHISWDCQILDTDFHEILDEYGNLYPASAPVEIGSRVLIGTGSIILKGVSIGNGSIVAAGSVVTRDVPPDTVVAGNPAREISKTQGWT